MRQIPAICAPGAAILLVLTALLAGARGQSSELQVTFPASPGNWINSGPITAEALQGKAAVLWYFEEDCPRCREKWPAMIATSQQFADKPIVFIGVNSGSSRAKIEQYVRDCKIPWPIVLDPSREFEKASGVPEISLQNIYQMKTINGAGQWANGNPGDLAGSAQHALAGAKWRVEPAEVPASLKQAWVAVEFGNFAAAAPLVKKGMVAASAEIKQAATKLSEAVDAAATSELEAAQKLSTAGEKWLAYKCYQAVGERFVGYAAAATAETEMKALAADEQVQKQQVATKALDAIKRAARTNAGRRGAVIRLRKFPAEHPGTEAAAEAQAIIDQLGPG